MMRKILRSIICFCAVAVIMACFVPKSLAFADEEIIYSLVPSSFNDAPTQTKDLYNIDEVSNSKPFLTDENGEFVEEDGGLRRLPGMSFRLESGEKNQIFDQMVKFKDAPALDSVDGKSLFMWINFDNYYLHNLSIKLTFENGASADWEIAAEKLKDMIVGNGTGLQPHGWRLMEFPFSCVTGFSGSISNQKMISMIISYVTNPVSELREYATLTFYDVYVANQKSEDDKISCLEKQPYLVREFYDLDETFRNSFVIGDELSIPSFESAVKYAYLGDINLKSNADFAGKGPLDYSWQASVMDPENQPKRVLSGEKFKFEAEGTYKLIYHCKLSGEDVFTHTQTFEVRELNPIYFNINALSAVVGEKYVISAQASSLITTAGNFEVVNVPAGLTVTCLDNGRIEIVASKVGNYEFEVQVKGTRLVKPEEDTYKVTFNVIAKKGENKDNLVLKIVLWSLLGVFGIILIVYAIILLVRARKFDVK